MGSGFRPKTKKNQGAASKTDTALSSNLAIITTQPQEVLFHYISDGQLDMLEDAKRDGLSEAMWAFIGIAGGSLIPTVRHLDDAYIENHPMSFIDLIEILMFFVFLAAAGVIYLVSKRRKTKTSDIITNIRNQPRITMAIVNQPGWKPKS